ncbi:MAG: SGNH/GDSL hydrolase family protein [Terriglobales bacterium]
MANANFTRVFSNSVLHSAYMKSTILALLFLLAGCGGTVQTSAPVARSGIVFVGDSIFGRFTAEPQFIQAGYIDAGVFGERTDQMLARFPDILSGQNICHGFKPPDGVAPDPQFNYACSTLPVAPAKVVIMGGWNNFFQGNANNSSLADLQQMVNMAHQQHVEVVICTLYAFDPAHPASWMVPTGNAPVSYYDMWRTPLNDGIRHMQSVAVFDADAVFSGQSDYTADGIHPILGASDVQLLNAIQQKL